MTMRAVWLGRLAFASALALALVTAYRFSPPVPVSLRARHCRVVVPSLQNLADVVDCDSPSFLDLAADPERLIAGPSRWQSRPLYVLSGTLLGAPFGCLSGDATQRLRGAYVGFVLFNVLALVWSIVLFETLLAGICEVFVVRALAVALLANDVVKIYAWMPHLQMLNVLEPLLLAWVIHHTATRSPIGWGRAVSYAALAGLAPLFYGSGFLLLPGLIVGLWSRPDAHRRGARARSAVLTAAMAMVFLVPVVAWMRFLVARTGFFFSLEIVAYRQFVWIVDRFSSSGLGSVAKDLAVASGVFAQKLLLVGWFPVLLLALATALAVNDRDATRAALRDASRLMQATLLALALNVVFFVTMGYYTERLSLNVVPLLLLLTGVMLAGPLRSMPVKRRHLIGRALLCTVLVWTAWQVHRTGPWSFHTSAWRAGSQGVHQVAIGQRQAAP